MDACQLKLSDAVLVCRSLSSILLQSLGPNALTSLVCTATGKLMVTNRGVTVLKYLQLEHPIGRLVTECIATQHDVLGDGSKSFLFILTELLVNLEHDRLSGRGNDAVERRHLVTGIQRFCDDFIPKFVLPALMSLVSETDQKCSAMREKSKTISQEIDDEMLGMISDVIYCSMQGKFSMQITKHIRTVMLDFLRPNLPSCTVCWRSHINIVLDNFESLVIENAGKSVLHSRTFSGFLCQRSFHKLAKPMTDTSKHLSFVLIGCSLDGDSELPTELSCKTQLQYDKAATWKKHLYEKFLIQLERTKVTLIIMTEQSSDLFAFLCKKHGISLIHTLPEEDMVYLSSISGVQLITDVLDHVLHTNVISNGSSIELKCIGSCEICKSININGQLFVHLEGIGQSGVTRKNVNCTESSCALGHTSPSQFMVLCGPNLGICNQLSLSVCDSLKCLRSALQSPDFHSPPDVTSEYSNVNNSHSTTSYYAKQYLIPGGGAFELMLHRVIQKFIVTCYDDGLKRVCQIIAKSVLCVPRHLLQNSYSSECAFRRLQQVLASGDAGHGVDGRSGVGMLQDAHIVESAYGKLAVLSAVLGLLCQILKVDQVVSVRKLQQSEEEEEE